MNSASLKNTKTGAEQSVIEVTGSGLSIEDIVKISALEGNVSLPSGKTFRDAIERSANAVDQAVAAGESIYGVTTLFGGMANQPVSPDKVSELQECLLFAHDASFGPRLPIPYIRAAMAVRLNNLCRGYSGVSWGLLERLVTCLNRDFVPHVRQYGSIGASGDLVPLATIAGAITGITPNTKVHLRGQTLTAQAALKQEGLPHLSLKPKEGLALINGTAMMAGIAALVLDQTQRLFALSLYIHAFMVQALEGTIEAFDPVLHAQKPHPGQAWVAQEMLSLLQGAKSTSQSTRCRYSANPNELIQDRYSIRCLPQFLGPIAEGLQEIVKQMGVEINATTDNPLVDGYTGRFYHGGHFLGQYIAMGMDRLRNFLALSAKHIDTQIALLMAPEFSRGLPPSLASDPQGLSVGCKALQLGGNSVVPLLEHLGAPLADRFPTHAEQFNQNINSQGMGACLLADQSIDLYQRYLAIALIIGVQAVDLRSKAMGFDFAGDAILSSKTRPLYVAVKSQLQDQQNKNAPLIGGSKEQSFSVWIERLSLDLTDAKGVIFSALQASLPVFQA